MAEYQDNRENLQYYRLVGKVENTDQEKGRVIAHIVKLAEKNYDKQWVRGISGYIVGADTKIFKHQGKDSEIFTITLKDLSGTCQLEFSASTPGYGLINCLLSADFKREILIEGYVNKAGYVGCSARYHGDKDSIKWGVPVEQIPKPTEYPNPDDGKMQKSYVKVIAFWMEKFKEIKAKATPANFPEASLALEAGKSDLNPANIKIHPGYIPKEKPSATTTPESDDDLPF